MEEYIMKRINMTKYGFIRFAEGDFSDDGNRFTAYTISSNSRLRISKLVSDGRVYLSSSMNGNKLDYTEYSKLPHYKDATWNYNGEDLEDLIEQDLVDFYNACVEYEKEYLEAEAKVSFPSIEDIKLQCETINAIRKAEIDEVSVLLERAAVKFLLEADRYELGRLRDYYNSLSKRFFDVDEYPQTIQKSNYGRNFIKPTNSDLQPSFYYKELMKILNKYL
jgi:hypothetical protein